MKVLAPNVIVSLKDALVHIYWYKNDLKTFLIDAIREPEILSLYPTRLTVRHRRIAEIEGI